MSEGMKKCIFCAEEIKAEAKICRFCNKEQNDPQAKSAEVIFYEGSVLHRTFIGEHILYGMVVIAGLVGGAIYGWGILGYSLAGYAGIGLAVAGLLGSLIRVIKTSSLRWKITDQRIETERGIISKQRESLPLWRIEDIEWKQSLMQRILNEATILVISSDRTTPNLAITGLSNHRALFEKLRESAEKRRRENRVMVAEQHTH